MRFNSGQRFFALLITILVGCGTPEYLSEEELKRFVLDPGNELKKTQTIGNTEITVLYRPTDLMVAQELDNPSSSRDSLVNELRSKYGRNYYFLLLLSKNGREALHQSGAENYSNLVQILSFEMAQHVFLTNAKDTVYVADYIMDRTFGIATSTNLLFAFKREDVAEGQEVRFCLNEFGLGTGNIRFTFDRENLDKGPSIRF